MRQLQTASLRDHLPYKFTNISKGMSIISGALLVGLGIYGALTGNINNELIGIIFTAAAGMYSLSIPNKNANL